jgi:hypothetical protein
MDRIRQRCIDMIELSNPISTQISERFRFGSVFASRALEQAFRKSQLLSSMTVASWSCILAMVGMLAFLVTDYRLFGNSANFYGLLAYRLGFMLACLVVLVVVQRRPTVATFEWTILAWNLLLAGGTIFVNSTRPSSLAGPIIVTEQMVLLSYCIIPLPLLLQMLPAAVYTISVFVFCAKGDQLAGSMTATAVVESFAIAHLLGILASRQLQRRKRQLFAAALRHSELSASLEQALIEIRTLRGILPICSHCKRVMNDAGAWEQVEVYVRKHTHAEFTHDICPECAHAHFPEYAQP